MLKSNRGRLTYFVCDYHSGTFTFQMRSSFASLILCQVYENPLLFITSILVKFRFSEKATKFEKNIPLLLTLLGENSCFVKTGGIFFQILWRSHNVLTLATDWFWKSRLYFVAQQRRLPQFLTVYALRFSVLHLFTRKKIKPFFFLTISCETRHNGSKVFIM